MDERAKEARRAYKRNWAKKNPEKVRAQQARYWAKKAAQAAEDAEEPQGYNKPLQSIEIETPADQTAD